MGFIALFYFKPLDQGWISLFDHVRGGRGTLEMDFDEGAAAFHGELGMVEGYG
jgi:hypothetical protein